MSGNGRRATLAMTSGKERHSSPPVAVQPPETPAQDSAAHHMLYEIGTSLLFLVWQLEAVMFFGLCRPEVLGPHYDLIFNVCAS